MKNFRSPDPDAGQKVCGTQTYGYSKNSAVNAEKCVHVEEKNFAGYLSKK
jgi:hypothetical protein